MATASLTLAIGGWLAAAETHEVSFYYNPVSSLLIVVCPVLAIVFGHIAIHRIHRGRATGQGRAIAGLVLGYLEAILLTAGIIWAATTG